jgi:hypothetical protein
MGGGVVDGGPFQCLENGFGFDNGRIMIPLKQAADRLPSAADCIARNTWRASPNSFASWQLRLAKKTDFRTVSLE